MNENFFQTFEALDLGPEHALQLARNSFEASFVDPALRDHWLAQVDRCYSDWSHHG